MKIIFPGLNPLSLSKMSFYSKCKCLSRHIRCIFGRGRCVHTSVEPTEPEEAIGFPGDGVTHSCELHNRGAEVQTWAVAVSTLNTPRSCAISLDSILTSFKKKKRIPPLPPNYLFCNSTFSEKAHIILQLLYWGAVG